jgi:hypothetical protein
MKHVFTRAALVTPVLALLLAGCGDLLSSQYAPEQQPTEPAETPPTLAQKIRGIWMVGGVSGGTVATVVDQIDLFDPETNTWYPSVTSFTAGGMTPVSFHGAVGYTRPVDGHHIIVAIGGFDDTNTTNAVQIYDVEANAWSAGVSMTQARANIQATLLYDKVYILGGCGSAASQPATTTYAGNTTTYEYTIGSTWNTKVNFGASGANRFSYVYGDVVYNLGGRTAATTFVNTHDGISVTGNALTTGATEVPLPSAGAGMAGALWDNPSKAAYVILVGGFTALAGSNQYFITNNATSSTSSNSAIALAYPFTAPSGWTNLTNFPQSIGFGAGAMYGDNFYYFGGTTTLIAASASGSASVYYADMSNLPAVTWVSAASMPVGRYGHSAVTFPQ